MNNMRHQVIKPENHIDHLRKHIGKKVKVEYLTPNQNNEICGQLIKVGNDFLCVKLLTSPLSTAIIGTDKVIKTSIIFE